MFMTLIRALKEEPAMDSVYINDFYPYGKGEKACIVRVPKSQEGNGVNWIFEDIGNDYDELTDGAPSDEFIYDSESYRLEFEDFKDKFKNEFPDVNIYHKEIDVLYKQYKIASQSIDCTGVVQLSDVDRFAQATIFTYVPPEGMFLPLCLESYYNSLQRVLPNLSLDYVGLKKMHECYLKDGFSIEDIEKEDLYTANELDKCIELDSAVDFVEDGLRDVRALKDADILSVHRGEESPKVRVEFDPYFDFMNGYGFRESEARKLLVYSKGLVDKWQDKVRSESGISEDTQYFLYATHSNGRVSAYRSPF